MNWRLPLLALWRPPAVSEGCPLPARRRTFAGCYQWPFMSSCAKATLVYRRTDPAHDRGTRMPRMSSRRIPPPRSHAVDAVGAVEPGGRQARQRSAMRQKATAKPSPG